MPNTGLGVRCSRLSIIKGPGMLYGNREREAPAIPAPRGHSGLDIVCHRDDNNLGQRLPNSWCPELSESSCGLIFISRQLSPADPVGVCGVGTNGRGSMLGWAWRRRSTCMSNRNVSTSKIEGVDT